MTAIRTWCLIALVLGAAAFVACKNDSNKNKTTKTPSNATKVATKAAATTAATTSASGGADLSDLVNNAGTKTIKATYTFNASGSTVTFTIYNKPPNWRFDVTDNGDTSIYISADGNDYICIAADQTCTASPIALTSLPFVGFFTNPQTLSGYAGSGANHSTKTVAGEDADCYSATADAQTGEVCFNHAGILVSLNAGGLTMEATDVSGTVSDSDLTPPYPVQ